MHLLLLQSGVRALGGTKPKPSCFVLVGIGKPNHEAVNGGLARRSFGSLYSAGFDELCKPHQAIVRDLKVKKRTAIIIDFPGFCPDDESIPLVGARIYRYTSFRRRPAWVDWRGFS